MNVHTHALMFTAQTTSLQLYGNPDPGNVIAHLGWFSYIYLGNKSVSNKCPYWPIWSEYFLIKTLFSGDFILYEAKN